MKNAFLIAVFMMLSITVSAQIDANSVIGIPTAITAEMNAIVGPSIGSVLYNTDDDAVYRYTSTGWQKNSDDQYDDEVLLRVAIDVNEGGVSGPTSETTVKEVIDAIALITSKAARVFYPPSIAIDASVLGSGSVNLYTQYTAQFATPAVKNPLAPAVIPTYAANELNYYITYYDTNVFSGVSVSDAGVMLYTVDAPPADYNSLINVVFVVK